MRDSVGSDSVLDLLPFEPLLATVLRYLRRLLAEMQFDGSRADYRDDTYLIITGVVVGGEGVRDVDRVMYSITRPELMLLVSDGYDAAVEAGFELRSEPCNQAAALFVAKVLAARLGRKYDEEYGG